MIYKSAPLGLALPALELRASGQMVSLEPQVFALLALLVENSERVVSRDEIIEKVWDGRIVSEAALSSRVKSARRALGDDGRSQQFIRTHHGQGYRFVAETRVVRAAAEHSAARSPDEQHAAGLGGTQRSERMVRPSL